ncbi:MAG: 30S ribosomal protein S2 [Alphaproteobacteria bacterium]|nr:30S ribosomal protein S2 [Alphaproteobacteria bacterium]|tara:strand:+ start:11295 stop:12197 length:903 start_codon:yes stop_codon:yes gene_type:complete
MVAPTFTMRQLLEAGVHFGHQTHRWNPKMSQFIFGVRNGIHIINLEQTVPMLHRALEVVRDIVSSGGRVLFVGTKRQASLPLTEAAQRCGQYYVNHRWLGGMLTNWSTISISIKRLKDLDEILATENIGLTKKELLRLTRERDRLERALGGIKEMGGIPDLLFVIDTNKEDIAIKEGQKLGIPVVAVVDSNSDPSGITYPIPGNDDALRAINLYCDLIVQSVLDGIQAEMSERGEDLGDSEEPVAEEIPSAAADTDGSAAQGASEEAATQTEDSVESAVQEDGAAGEESSAEEAAQSAAT